MSTKLLLKFKSNRFLKENIWPLRKLTYKQKEILAKLKKYKTGSAAPLEGSSRQKMSNFGLFCYGKRFLSVLYGNLSWKQIHKTYKEAQKLKGKIGNNFICILEKRLDTVVYRMNFLRTFRAGKQLINHNKVFVNNICINIPSYKVDYGDIISIAPDSFNSFSLISKQSLNDLNENVLCKSNPLHLEINYKILTAIFLYPPQKLIFAAEWELPKIK